MKKALLAASLALPSLSFAADHYVNGYTKQDGTYVAPHYQANPNATRVDNYSTVGNVNPYTGVSGTKPLVPNQYDVTTQRQTVQPPGYPAYARQSSTWQSSEPQASSGIMR